jgi:hypothetical protein
MEPRCPAFSRLPLRLTLPLFTALTWRARCTLGLFWPLISSRAVDLGMARAAAAAYSDQARLQERQDLQSVGVTNRIRVTSGKTRDTTGSRGRNQDGSMPRFLRWLSRSGEPVRSRLSLAEPARVQFLGCLVLLAHRSESVTSLHVHYREFEEPRPFHRYLRGRDGIERKVLGGHD